MSKWADWCVTNVRMSETGTRIAAVRVCPDLGESLGVAQEWKRQKVVDAIDGGATIVTVVSRDGKWVRGEDVHVVTVGNDHYIRTDRNATTVDNLGELPGF